MIKINKCPLFCNNAQVLPYQKASEANKWLYKVDTGYAELETALIVSYVQCMNCGLVWQSPRMDDYELKKYYSEGYYRSSLGNSQESMDADELSRSKRIFDQIAVPLVVSFLDIGCSRGYLVKMVEDTKRIAWGVESNPNYVTEKIHVAESMEFLPKLKFDCITMIHVLEHTTDPMRELYAARNRLSKNGVILVEVPSTKSLGGPLRLAHTFFFEPWVLVHMAGLLNMQVLSLKKEEHTQIWLGEKA